MNYKNIKLKMKNLPTHRSERNFQLHIPYLFPFRIYTANILRIRVSLFNKNIRVNYTS